MSRQMKTKDFSKLAARGLAESLSTLAKFAYFHGAGNRAPEIKCLGANRQRPLLIRPTRPCVAALIPFTAEASPSRFGAYSMATS